MLNHIHLIVQSSDVAGFVRDFKKHTARKLIENLEKTEPRVADLFKDPQDRYSIWQETNMPQVIQSEKFFRQKNTYIEQNPVRKKYVDEISHWLYSSAHKNKKIIISSLFDL